MLRINQCLHGALALAIACSLALPLAASADQPSDAWITTKVKMALLVDEVVSGFDVYVDTFDGRVTLHGVVASDAERARAEERTRQIDGVSDVRNLLAVVPDAARKVTKVADDELSKQVSTVLERDEALTGSDIQVESVSDGLVLLSGNANTLSAHRRALEDARSVDGVRNVASEIKSPNELGDAEIWHDADTGAEKTGEAAARMVSDGWITTKAKVFLMADPGLSPIAINVDTRRGVVTLFGIVSSKEAKTRAGVEVGKLDGVKSVVNELQVVPDVAAGRVEAKDEEISAAVQERFDARKALEDADIGIEVKNGVVRLTGTVASLEDRLTALTVARATKGVSSVIDDLEMKSKS